MNVTFLEEDKIFNTSLWTIGACITSPSFSSLKTYAKKMQLFPLVYFSAFEFSNM